MDGLPAGYTARPVEIGDAPAIVAMLNLEAERFVGEPQFTVEEYAVDLQEPGFDRQDRSRIVLAPDGSAAGVVELYQQVPYVHPFAWVRVHPVHTGRGLGTALTEWAEAKARCDMGKAPAGARISLVCNGFANNTAARALFDSMGFRQVRVFYSMRVEFDTAPAEPVWPAGIQVRTMQIDVDDEAVFRATDEAFGDHWGHVERPFEDAFAHWKHRKFSDPSFDPTLQFLAMDGDTIAGTSLCYAAGAGAFDIGWIDQLGVRRPWRQRGLAQALLLHTFGEFYRRGTTKVGLGVDADSLTGATRLYEKAGMYVHHSTVTFEKELRPGVELATESVGA